MTPGYATAGRPAPSPNPRSGPVTGQGATQNPWCTQCTQVSKHHTPVSPADEEHPRGFSTHLFRSALASVSVMAHELCFTYVPCQLRDPGEWPSAGAPRCSAWGAAGEFFVAGGGSGEFRRHKPAPHRKTLKEASPQVRYSMGNKRPGQRPAPRTTMPKAPWRVGRVVNTGGILTEECGAAVRAIALRGCPRKSDCRGGGGRRLHWLGSRIRNSSRFLPESPQIFLPLHVASILLWPRSWTELSPSVR